MLSPDGVSAQVIGSDEFLPADELDTEMPPAPLPSGSPRGALGATPGQGERKGKRWGIPPIRWGGELSLGMRRSESDAGASSTSQVYEARLRASSYIMQPYIALVSGDFGLTTFRSQDGGGDASANNLSGTSINGSGTLNVFPRSRFPFDATLSLSDSRSAGGFSDTNTKTRRLALRQQYRPNRGDWHASGGYDRSELEGTFGSDIVDRLSANFNDQFGRQSLALSGDISKNRTRDGETNNFYASASHGFNYSEELFFNTLASIVDQRSSFQTDAQSFDSRASSLQVFSYTNWTPRDSKLRANGNLRYFQNRTESSTGGAFDRKTLAANASTTYQATRNLSLNGSLGFSTDLDSQTSSTQSAGASYSGDSIRLGEFTYNWFSSVSASNANASASGSSRSMNASLGHSLSRYWPLSQATSLSTNINQSISSSRSTGLGSVTSNTLSNSASVSVSANAGDSLNGYLSASLSDSRSIGGSNSSFQMLNIQLSGNWRVNPLSEFNSNLSWQISRQESENNQPTVVTDEFGQLIVIDDTSRNQNSSLAGTLGYGHRRVFGVRGLRYRLDFRANTNTNRNARRFGDPNAERADERITMDLDQRLLYSIGRFDTELQYRIAEIDGARDSLIFLRATRSFGAF